ncbi:hypothetical protein [Anaerotignum sp.]|uniref:hypothetical protein n=1 Tax=Anaerotignum sp. TaxID=2039241 RepID=UPI002714724C|nr:hypothetical protein [Anaerotignum sp.]
MAKTVGLGTKQVGKNAESTLLVEENKKLKAEVGKVLKEKMKVTEDNKVLKKEMGQLKKMQAEQFSIPDGSDVGE